MFKNKRIPYIEFLPLIIIIILIYRLMDYSLNFLNFFKLILGVIQPILIGLSIAFILNPIMMFFENRIKSKYKRGISLALTYLLCGGILVLLINVLLPTIMSSVSELVENLPRYLDTFSTALTKIFKESDLKSSNDLIKALTNFVAKFISEISNSINIFLTSTITTIFRIGSILLNFVISIVISIYVLKDKELICFKSKQFFRAILNDNYYTKILTLANNANLIFSSFIVGKAIDSLIIGTICFLGLIIFKFKFALLIALIIGITNMIPYFGPFIGAIPAVILTIFDSPSRAVGMVIFIFILQQFDGLYLGPKILGDQLGLTPLLVMISILIGGGLFGFIGMFLGVPVFALGKTMYDSWIEYIFKKKNIKI
ncbi:AI-2E family transporter [uncultured Clostridium sp.]|uniref:AI-2E family transporter n=1 Tax=uncultured Clostridium sp. TaxID=59620 RepID=UPI0025DB89CE|nr:AI-2E family transporter [uncultured Clostridium sp.]